MVNNTLCVRPSRRPNASAHLVGRMRPPISSAECVRLVRPLYASALQICQGVWGAEPPNFKPPQVRHRPRYHR